MIGGGRGDKGAQRGRVRNGNLCHQNPIHVFELDGLAVRSRRATAARTLRMHEANSSLSLFLSRLVWLDQLNLTLASHTKLAATEITNRDLPLSDTGERRINKDSALNMNATTKLK